MNKTIAIVLLALITSVSTAVAVHEAGYGGYTGQPAIERRMYDPFSREQYYGVAYQWDFNNFGSKGPPTRLLNTGAKSAYSGVFNLDTNSYVNRGRDPSKISNWDPNVRGQSRLDVSVDLLPYNPVDVQLGPQSAYSKGTARIVSEGHAYGSGQNVANPQTEIYITLRGMPPIGEDQFYEAWLFDAESEYALSIGYMKAGIGNTGQFTRLFNMQRMVDMFDAVMITAEPVDDADPSPSDNVVLWGDIEKPRASTRPLGSMLDLRFR